MVPQADELEELAQKIRQGTLGLSTDASRIIGTMVDHLQHSTHELRDAAKAHDHDDAHHAFEGVKDELDTIEKEIQRYGRASG